MIFLKFFNFSFNFKIKKIKICLILKNYIILLIKSRNPSEKIKSRAAKNKAKARLMPKTKRV